MIYSPPLASSPERIPLATSIVPRAPASALPVRVLPRRQLFPPPARPLSAGTASPAGGSSPRGSAATAVRSALLQEAASAAAAVAARAAGGPRRGELEEARQEHL